MALPVTITGLSLGMASVGPYQSSGGNYYCFGMDGSDSTTVRCMKATDPTVSWSSIDTQDGYTGSINDIAGYQKNDVIHLVICDGSTYSQFNYKYLTFDMATDAFVLAETIISNVDTGGPWNAPLCSIAVRSTDQPVVLFQGAVATYFRIYYSLRTGTNTWAAAVEVDDVAAYSARCPVALLGDNDTIQFVYFELRGDPVGFQKALTSGNELQTSTSLAYGGWYSEGISYDLAGTTKCIVVPFTGGLLYFDAGNSPTLYCSVDPYLDWGINSASLRLFASGGMAYVLYSKTAGSNKEYYFRSTDDGGAHWSPEVSICTATNSGELRNTSRFSRIYSAASEVVLPFVYADSANTELKHNHKVVRSTILQGVANFVGGGIFISTGIGGDFTAPLEDPFRLRFSILNEGGTLDAAPWELYVSKNGGAYHAVTTTSDDAYSLNAGSSPDETPIYIPRLTIPA